PFKASIGNTSAPLDIIHVDLTGPVKPLSRDGHAFAIMFTDYDTKKIDIYFQKRKTATEVLKKFKEYNADTAIVGRAKIYRADNGPEFNLAKEWCRENGIKFENTVPYTPEQQKEILLHSGDDSIHAKGIQYR